MDSVGRNFIDTKSDELRNELMKKIDEQKKSIDEQKKIIDEQNKRYEELKKRVDWLDLYTCKKLHKYSCGNKPYD